jgi:hypothetical protein
MSTTTPDKPHVLLVSLDPTSLFDQMYQPFLAKLNTFANLDRATNLESAIQALANYPPHAVLVTDGGICQHVNLYATLLKYVRRGGTLVHMGNFNSMTRPSDMNALFEQAGLSWMFAEYRRTTVWRNDIEETAIYYTSLPSSYSQKAVFLAGVSRKDAWYLADQSWNATSSVFPLLPLALIALTNIGKGKFGYVSDVDGEEGCDEVVLAMCGFYL